MSGIRTKSSGRRADRARRKRRRGAATSSASSAVSPVEVLGPERAAEPLDQDSLLIEAELLPAEESERAGDETALAVHSPLRRYIAEIRHYPPLTAEEEHQLAVRYRVDGDLGAGRRLVTANLRLVVKLARMFHRMRLNILDLIQEGNLGLLQAVQRFDPFRGLRLSTYAYWWIKAYILKFVLDNWRLVRIGTTAGRRRLLYNLSKEQRLLEARGIEAGPRLLAERFGVSEQDVREVAMNLGQKDVSLDAPLDQEGTTSFTEVLPSEGPPVDEALAAGEMQELMQRKFREFAATLDERDRYVLEHRLLADQPETLEAIGRRFGITREGIRQVERKLLQRLKAFMERELEGFSFKLRGRGKRGGH